MTRDEYIQILLPGVRESIIHFVGAEQERRARQILDSKTTHELSLMYAKHTANGSIRPQPTRTAPVTDADVEAARAQGEAELETLREQHREALAITRAERDADRLEFRRQQDEAAIPERREAILRARQVITDAQSVLRSFTLNEAVFALIIRELGTDVTAWTIQQALDSHAISLPAPSEAERQVWAEQDIQTHNRRLLDMRPDQLKEAIKREAAQTRQQVEQAEAARVQKLQEQTDSYLGYPELPEFNDKGEKLDSLFFRRAPATTIRRYAQRYGIANLNKRIMGR